MIFLAAISSSSIRAKSFTFSCSGEFILIHDETSGLWPVFRLGMFYRFFEYDNSNNSLSVKTKLGNMRGSINDRSSAKEVLLLGNLEGDLNKVAVATFSNKRIEYYASLTVVKNIPVSLVISKASQEREIEEGKTATISDENTSQDLHLETCTADI
ncbi:MAG: hypothetical protein QE271_11855 [Bacteriovoracaceae bacterium]|nr:hypothetical protein [Bacteriovoracaceae bacterium]